MGDSITFGDGLQTEDLTYAQRIEAYLAATYPDRVRTMQRELENWFESVEAERRAIRD